MQRNLTVTKTQQKSLPSNNFLRRVQRGSSLIEVLVTLMIMAVGLLGLASIQMISIKNLNNSQFRSLATDYAYDMAERMRANSTGVEDGDYDALDTSSASDPNSTSCSTSEIAQLDEYQWAEMLTQDVISGGLPSGSGTVTKNSSVYDITIQWKEQGRDSNGGKIETADFTLTVQL
jgi:type IV pilus assembly protein PilV